MTKEQIIKQVIFLGEYETEEVLNRLESSKIKFSSAPIKDILSAAHPNSPWLEPLFELVDLSKSVKQLRSLDLEKEPDTHTLIRLAEIINSLYEKYSIPMHISSRYVRKQTKIRTYLIKLWNILICLNIKTPKKIRMYLNGVIKTRSIFISFSKELLPPRMLSSPTLIFNFIQYYVKVWYKRYGSKKEEDKQRWYFEMSDYEKMYHVIMSLVQSRLKEANVLGISRLAFELELLEAGREGVWYTTFCSKFTKSLFEAGFFDTMYPDFKEWIKDTESAAKKDSFNFIKKLNIDVNKLMEEYGIEDYDDDWDIEWLESACQHDSKKIKEVLSWLEGKSTLCQLI